jgi:hypothetical protein
MKKSTLADVASALISIGVAVSLLVLSIVFECHAK